MSILISEANSGVFVLILRIFAAVLGAFCIGTAALLYPKNEGKIQSRLEDLWVQVDDFRKIPISKHAAFMARIARLETKLLDLLFGKDLFSEQAALVSLSVSIVSSTFLIYGIFKLLGALAASVAIASAGDFVPTQKMPELSENSLLVTLACLGVAIGVVAIALRKSKPFVRRTVEAGLTGLIVVTCYFANAASILIFYLPLAILGFICDALFIAATRSLLRWAGTMQSALKILGLIIADFALAMMLVSPYYFSSWLDDDTFHWYAVGVALSNVLDIALASVFFLLCLLLLLHMMFWPLLTRTVFRLQDIGTTGRRGILVVAGSALIGVAFHVGKTFEIFVKIWEKFAS